MGSSVAAPFDSISKRVATRGPSLSLTDWAKALSGTSGVGSAAAATWTEDKNTRRANPEALISKLVNRSTR